MNTNVDPLVTPPRITDGFKLMLAWTCASLGALVVALAPLSASLVNGRYLPIGPDSFYHARRILDAVTSPGGFFQFDSSMHVPEGSVVTWPWGYDFTMALIIRAALALGLGSEPMAVLVHLPVLAFVIAIAIMVALCRGLKMSPGATFLALLGTAFFPMSQSLYSIGNIDHHFAEHLFVLASLAASVCWLREPGSRTRAIITGLVLGTATSVHTGLFVLQIPLLAAFAVMWLRRMPLPSTTLQYAVSLVAGTLAVCAPSLPFLQGRFEFYTLSWFQLYVAACSAVLSVLLSRTRFSPRGLLIAAGTGLLMLLPVAGQTLLAHDFFAVKMEGMALISEVQSPWQLWQRSRSFGYVVSIYTYFILLLPLTFALILWRLWQDREPWQIVFWIGALLGLTLLTFQLRLQYFGSFALFLPWLLLLDEQASRLRFKPAYVWAVAGVVLAGLYSPGLTAHIFVKQIEAGDPNYAVTSAIYDAMGRECARNPGTVLANPDDGHYIRFHTRCSVIGNPFLVTRQHVEKVREERRLLSLPAAELTKNAAHVRYIYVRRDSMFFSQPNGMLEFAPGDYPSQPDYPLVRELLNADAATLPPHWRIVFQMRMNGSQSGPYARLIAIGPAAASAPAAP